MNPQAVRPPASTTAGPSRREPRPLTGAALEAKLESLLRAAQDLSSREAAARVSEHQNAVASSMELLNPLVLAEAIAQTEACIAEERSIAARITAEVSAAIGPLAAASDQRLILGAGPVGRDCSDDVDVHMQQLTASTTHR